MDTIVLLPPAEPASLFIQKDVPATPSLHSTASSSDRFTRRVADGDELPVGDWQLVDMRPDPASARNPRAVYASHVSGEDRDPLASILSFLLVLGHLVVLGLLGYIVTEPQTSVGASADPLLTNSTPDAVPT